MNNTLSSKPIVTKPRMAALICIVLFLAALIPMWFDAASHLHPDMRLVYERKAYHEHHLTGSGQYLTSVWEGSGQFVEYASVRIRFDVSEMPADARIRCYLMTYEDTLFDHLIPLSSVQEDGILQIPVQKALDAGVSYQFVLMSDTDAELLVTCTRDSGSPAVILHTPLNDTTQMLRLFRVFSLITCLLYFALTASIILFFTSTKKALILLGISALLLTCALIFLTDFLADAPQALAGSFFMMLIMILYVILHLFFPDKRLQIMYTLLIAVGIFYLFFIPRGVVPDERTHFYRSFDISCGNLFPAKNADTGEGGNILPVALHAFENKHSVINWEQTEEISFSSMSFYSSVCYLPQAIGIRIARLFTPYVHIIFMAGRAGACLFALILALLSLKLIPVGRELLFAVFMLPTTQLEMASLSADAITNALIFFYLSYVLHLVFRDTQEPLKKREMIILLISGVAISLCKLIYVVVTALLLLIPVRNKKGRLMHITLIIIPVVCCIISNLAHSAYVMTYIKGADAGAQVLFALSHPLQMLITVLRTVTELGGDWFDTMTIYRVTTDWVRTTPAAGLISLSIIIYLLFHTTCRQKENLRKISLVSGIVTVVGFLLVLASIYAIWIPVGGGLIVMIYGRYFIPLLPILFVSIITGRTATGTTIVSGEQSVKDAVYLTDVLQLFTCFITFSEVYRLYVMGTFPV